MNMHAVLITAYKDNQTLLRLVRRLDPSFFNLFIHIDKRSRIRPAEIDQLKALGAEVHQTFVVRWGSYSHLEAILLLMNAALDRGGSNYIHIISGQDYPLWDAAEFKRRCNDHIFVDYCAVDEQPSLVRERYEFGDPFHRLLTGPAGSGRVHKFLWRKSRWIHRHVAAPRTQFGPYRSLFKSLVWSSFPIWAAAELRADPIAEEFLHAIRNTRVPEEIFFPTYFLNSKLAPFVVRDSLRYVDWRERNGSCPAYLDASDVDAVLSSNALFARKVSSETSADLLDRIDAIRFASSV